VKTRKRQSTGRKGKAEKRTTLNIQRSTLNVQVKTRKRQSTGRKGKAEKRTTLK